MNASLQIFQPFSLLGNVCPVGDFSPVNQAPMLIGTESNRKYTEVSRAEKCTNCCTSAGYCTSESKYCTAPTCLFDYGIPCDATLHPTGPKSSNIDRSHIGEVPYGKGISSCTAKGTVALTYDDGPCEWSSDLLDILKKNNIKATFFLVGWRICKGQKHHDSTEYSSIVKRIYKEGHQIASHTWSHKSMDKKTTEERNEDMVKMELAFSDILGFVPTYWRPPFGECKTKQCQTDLGVLGYHTILWDIDTRDWEGNYTYSENKFLSHISRTHSSNSSGLTVLHETHRRTVHEFTQWAIDRAQEQGYRFVRVGECLNDPEQNWYRYPSREQSTLPPK